MLPQVETQHPLGVDAIERSSILRFECVVDRLLLNPEPAGDDVCPSPIVKYLAFLVPMKTEESLSLFHDQP